MTETSLKSTVQSDLTASMRARDALRSSTLRMVLTAITTEEVSGTEARTLTDDEVLTVLAREAKKRREAAAAYAGAGRPELADQEETELAILQAYLPAQLDDAEVDAIVAEAIASTGATGMQQMGQVMKAAQGAVAGRAEGGRVASAVRAQLAAL